MGADNTAELLKGLKQRDADAEHQIFEQYFQKLVALARKRLPRRYSKARDEWDLAQSTMKSLFRRFALGAYPDLNDRDSLWAVMAAILMRKLSSSIRFERAKRRNQDRTISAVDFEACAESNDEDLVAEDQNIGNLTQNPYGDADLLIEYVEQGLSLLTPRQRHIATLILEGLNPHEVSKTLEVAPSTVARNLDHIATIWRQQLDR
jgi:RNA polymerase sigma factor (sigma-70 family)